jgi:uncharacterized membrane protein YkvA (DUF1232 family)
VSPLVTGVVATLAVLLALWLVVVAIVWLHRPTREQATTYVRLVPDVARLVYRLARDRATPRRYRVALLGLAAWLAMPIDLIPDFLPVIGVLDDVILAAVVLRWVGRGLGVERIAAHWSGSPDGLVILRRVLGAPTISGR